MDINAAFSLEVVSFIIDLKNIHNRPSYYQTAYSDL